MDSQTGVSPATVTAAVAAASHPLYRSVCVTVRYSSGAPFVVYETMHGTPNRRFEEHMRRLDHDRAMSRIYDSRLEKLCYDHELDPGPRREALEAGNSIAFVRIQGGKQVLLHRIRPEEIS